MQFLFLLAASLLFAYGGLFMKYSDGLSRLGPSLGIFACFCGGAGLQALAMRNSEMGSTYVFVLGLEALAAFGLAAVYLQERISTGKVVALLLIVGGMMLLNREM